MTLFKPGENCYAAARAERAAILVGADEYLRAFRDAAIRARHSIIIIGWRFDDRTLIARGRRRGITLGDFLNRLARRRRTLRIRILAWDFGALHGGEMRPLYGTPWHPHPRVHLHYDSAHAEGCSQHQKIVVVDDAVAFCGSADLASRGAVFGQGDVTCNDVMALVDSDAARALGEIARRRWTVATGEVIPVSPRARDPWPASTEASFADVEVGISRTHAPHGEGAHIREIEALHLDAIAHAKHSITIENPHFTSAAIAGALQSRLAEAEGPHVMLITGGAQHGWLDAATLTSARATLLSRLRAADADGRLQVLTPSAARAECIDCDARWMAIDDEWLHVGSASLTNRSMRFDSECGITLAAAGDARNTRAIAGFRERAQRAGSLSPFEASGDTPPLALPADRPEPAVPLDALVEQFAPDTSEHASGPAWGKIAAIAVAFAALTALWRYTPLSEVFTADRVIAWAEEVGSVAWAPLAVIAAYSPACFVMFPRPLITLFAVIAFGPALGLFYSLVGILGAALSTYFAGCALPRDTVRKLAGDKLNEMTEVLRRRGLVAIFAVRIVPVAPFAIEGMVAGAVGIKLWHYTLGTLLGMLPGTLTTTVFGQQIKTALEDPSRINYWLVGAVALFFVGVIWTVRRWFLKEHRLAEAARGRPAPQGA